MSTLYDKLKRYGNSDYYGFHMPGHKRNLDMLEGMSPYRLDITEIEGFDDLHHPQGILKESQERAARVYHAEETHFLINGSTVGILSAVLGITRRGDGILVARNCHKSVYHAIYMNELNPVYLYPGFDKKTQLNTEISVQDVKEALNEYPQIRAVVIVSPTYDGVVSDVAAIASAAHEKGVPVIVDEAHGAHFGFHSYFPDNSNVKGADIVIHSLHKTLPSLTQTALLHMNGELADRERVREYLHMLQSSSPSYVLMGGIDCCIRLLEKERTELFEPYVRYLKEMRERFSWLQSLRLLEAEEYDRSKVLISGGNTGLTGKDLYRLFLENYHLQMEMTAGTYVLAMTSVGDTKEGMERFERAVCEIDHRGEAVCGETVCKGNDGHADMGRLPRLPRIYTSFEIQRMSEMEKGSGSRERNSETTGNCVKTVPWERSEGLVSLEYAYLYPPGSPMIVPGEQITQELIRELMNYRALGFRIEGLKTEGQIEVWTDGADLLYNG